MLRPHKPNGATAKGIIMSNRVQQGLPSSRVPIAPGMATQLDAELAELSTLEERLAWLRERIVGPIAFSTSLGLEDQAVLHGLHIGKLNIDVFTLDTGRHFAETLETIAESERKYRRSIRLIAPDAKAVEVLTARDGVLGFRHSIAARKACCEVRKVAPLRRSLLGAAGWLTGLRRGQAAGRAAVPFAAWEAGLGLIKLNPIADWSDKVLADYIRAHDIPVNSLHAHGYPSIGCQPCTRAIRPGEDIRAGRWWWENEDGKECGLHNRPKTKGPAA